MIIENENFTMDLQVSNNGISYKLLKFNDNCRGSGKLFELKNQFAIIYIYSSLHPAIYTWDSCETIRIDLNINGLKREKDISEKHYSLIDRYRLKLLSLFKIYKVKIL